MQLSLQQATLLIWILAALAVAAGISAACFFRSLKRLRGEYAEAKQTLTRNQAIVEASGEGVLELDQAGKVRFANPATVRMLGYELEEILGRDYLELMTAGVEESNRGMGRLGYTTDMMRGVGAVLRCKSGRLRPVEYRMVPVKVGQNGSDTGSVITFRDLSERVRTDLMLADMQQTAQVGAWELMVDAGVVNVTERVSQRLNLTVGRPIPVQRVLSAFKPEDIPSIEAAARAAIVEGRSFDLELRLADATDDWVRCIGKAERIDGRTLRLYGTIQNVTERKLAERTLRETRDFFSATLDAMPSLVMHVGAAGQVTYCNRSPLRSLLASKEPLGERIETVLGGNYADMRTHIAAALDNRGASDVRVLKHGAEHRDVQLNFIPGTQPGGSVTGCFIVFTDVSELKNLEERLRQAEKLQLIGQLTGGVAHDFNNLLGVILGNLQLMERDVGKDPGLAKKLSTAMRAALRGADLTRRLLTFARRQLLAPSIVNLRRQLTNFNDLMQRTLGESIETRLVLGPDLWQVRVDPGQLESAILNLAINARDAMPSGGRLVVEARNIVLPTDLERLPAPLDPEELAPGDYVVISVIDTGSGIPPELLSRVFDPFFTTKESGKGSGLGLSIVQSFAKQSGGAAAIRSEHGRGTTVSLFFPRSVEAQPAHEDTIVLKKMPGGDETILVVEDNTDLRATTRQNLQQLGYDVLEAANGEAALRIMQSYRQIDLLFTDIMMPGMPGTTLAKRARELLPNLRVLFTTGYVDDTAATGVHALVADEVIAKPYRNEELALKVRHALDQEVPVA